MARQVVNLRDYRRRRRSRARTLLLVAVNLLLVVLFWPRAAQPVHTAVRLNGLPLRDPALLRALADAPGPDATWMLNVRQDLLETHLPASASLHFKPVLWPGQPRLLVEYEEDYPWAAFEDGSVLTSSGRVLSPEEASELPEMGLVSRTTIGVAPGFEPRPGGDELKDLIVTANQQLPDASLKRIRFRSDNTVVLEYDGVSVQLGTWEEEAWQRLRELSKLAPLIRKHPGDWEHIDLRSQNTARLKRK